jgi:PAS domain S-box-containing protein
VVEAGHDIDFAMGRLIQDKSADDGFFNDIIVQEAGHFIGLISVRDLLMGHLENMTHRLTAMEAQLAALARKNKELFENSFRQGRMETQYKDIFERTPVPIVVFDEHGKFVSGNQHFIALADYTTKQIDTKLSYRKLFEGDFRNLFDQENRKWKDLSLRDEPSQYSMVMITRHDESLPCQVLADLTPDGQHIMLTIINSGKNPLIGPHDIVESKPAITHTKPPGKITQAIKMKLSNANAIGLARSVATNLIDRQEDMDQLMRKLETIIDVAQKIENRSEEIPAPGSAEQAGLDEPMRGKLTDFSVIDLAQILVQGTKTGQLMLLRKKEPRYVGSIYFYCGSIIHAEAHNSLSGEEALPALLNLKDGSFEFLFNQNSPVTSINGDAMGILMDACRRADEQDS